jgi:hypothetical protein
MTEPGTPRVIFLSEINEAVRDHPLGEWFVGRVRRTDDGHALGRIVREIGDTIRGLGSAREEGPDAAVGLTGLTDAEAAFAGRFRLRDRNGVVGLILNEGWTARRIQNELVSLLRLLIALDPDNLAIDDVSVAADDVLDVDAGRRAAWDVVSARLIELPVDDSAGLHFRHGLALGMRLARHALEDGHSLTSFDAQIDDTLGVTAPMERPDRAGTPQ